MRSFKDFAQTDSSFFFNNKEFGETIDIEGTPVNVVIDNDTLKINELKNGGEGLANNGLLFYVQKNVLPFKPHPEQDLIVDDIYYVITDLQEDDFVYTVTLKAVRS